MDFDSPDVEKDFPGLYASEGADGKKSKKSKEESDYSEGDHDKISKKDLLIGRRKDKKDKNKSYATLEGCSSSPEEELDAKSPSKSKKSKTFKFTTSKSKEKREKSRDKEKLDREVITKDAEGKSSPKEGKIEKDKDHKKKDKERKDKDKKEKVKEKEKEKKDKKSKQPPASGVSEEVLELELGDMQPVFGVSVSLATERSRCHDGIDLPLVIRDCIDYLQEHGLKSEQMYKVEPVKTRLQHYKRLYNNRERQPETDELDIPTACGLLKLFLKELPEPILTTDLIPRFEEAASHQQVTKQQEELQQLLELLPKCNRTLLSWILLHFDAVIQNEKSNKMNAQSLAMILSPPLQMSHRLLVALLCHCPNLFADVKLIKYIPPLTSSSPKLPDTPGDIQIELRKQESLLAQIHSEMNAGFVSKKREEQLWEVQRIITQLKRKLRSFEKKQERSFEEQTTGTAQQSHHAVVNDTVDSRQTLCIAEDKNVATQKSGIQSLTIKTNQQTDESTDKYRKNSETTIQETTNNNNNKNTIASTTAGVGVGVGVGVENDKEQIPITTAETVVVDDSISTFQHSDGLYIDKDSGFLMLPKTHPEYANLIQLQLENQELLAWKAQLQARIGLERAEILRLKQLYQTQSVAATTNAATVTTVKKTLTNNVEELPPIDGDYEKIIENYIRENSLLEHKKLMLAKEIFDERHECIKLQVELAMQQF